MLSSGRAFLRDAPHVTTFPGLAILLTVLALNLFGDGLRDALDPRLRRR
jgi:peptide/nickel transport system permease protein